MYEDYINNKCKFDIGDLYLLAITNRLYLGDCNAELDVQIKFEVPSSCEELIIQDTPNATQQEEAQGLASRTEIVKPRDASTSE